MKLPDAWTVATYAIILFLIAVLFVVAPFLSTIMFAGIAFLIGVFVSAVMGVLKNKLRPSGPESRSH